MADAAKYPTRIAPFGLRMPDDLKARVQAAAEANNRSLNAEIVATLEEKYPAPSPRQYDLGDVYLMMDRLSMAEDDDQQFRILQEVNHLLAVDGAEVRVKLSEERDRHGIKQPFIVSIRRPKRPKRTEE